MYKGKQDTLSFFRALKSRASEFQSSELVVFVQTPLLALVQEEMKAPELQGGWLHYGPQNIYWEEKGAFTGELSPVLAKEFGCQYALAGHSERRQFFGETNESAAKRAVATHRFGLRSVFCVGEHLAERDAGKTFEVLRLQMQALFAIQPKALENFSIAYEPVWAIGTGRTASAAQAQEAHAFLRSELETHWGRENAQKIRLLYGGSVKPENAKELLHQKDVDGVLVGGASLEPDSFLAIAAAGK